MAYQRQDVLTALHHLGIQKGDTLFIHSQLFSLGLPLNVENKEDFCHLFFEALKEVVGQEGTLIVPTFTYSYCKKEIFDPLTTPSTVGLFSNFVFHQKEVERSHNGIYSIAVWGRNKKLYTQDNKNVFGSSGLYSKLFVQDRAFLLSIGLGLYGSFTFIHAIEREVQSSYRYLKIFHGQLKLKGCFKKDLAFHFVRYLDSSLKDIKVDHFENLCLEKGILKKENLGKNFIQASSFNELSQESRIQLETHPYYFCPEKPVVKNPINNTCPICTSHDCAVISENFKMALSYCACCDLSFISRVDHPYRPKITFNSSQVDTYLLFSHRLGFELFEEFRLHQILEMKGLLPCSPYNGSSLKIPTSKYNLYYSKKAVQSLAAINNLDIINLKLRKRFWHFQFRVKG